MERKFLSKEEIQEVYINQNRTSIEAAKILKVSKKVFFSYLREYGLTRNTAENRSKWTKIYDDDKLREQVKELYIDQQKTAAEVKKLLKISAGKLFEIIKSLGYTRPTEIKVNNMKKTCKEKYGVEFALQDGEVREKVYKSCKDNKSFRSSKPENRIYEKLVEVFGKEDIERQYRSEAYPFNCDFYIKSLDLYIEYQGIWTHGNEPYDPTNVKHIELIEEWERKAQERKISGKKKSWFKNAIKKFTIMDPKKRAYAQKNNLNWIEFFSEEEFDQWVSTQGL